MPWFWSDDAASILRASSRTDTSQLEHMTKTPFAMKCDAQTIREAAELFLEDDEPPLAA